MPERQVTIVNKLGLHARAASKLVNLAKGFVSNIELVQGETRVDGKRIMSVMLLGATQGTDLVLAAEGEDADEALEALAALIADYFGEGQ